MSLATRCNSCGTVFRVVQDQLKISEGWVRCGRCNAVFNALEGLFDLGREPAEQDEPVGAATTAAAAPAAAAAAKRETLGERTVREPTIDRIDYNERTVREPALDRGDDEDEDDDGPLTAPLELGEPLVDPIDAHLFRKRGGEVERAAAVQVDARDRHEFSDARFDSDLFAESPSAIDPTLLDSLTTASGDLPLESTIQQPDFLRRAERRARWRSGPMRAGLIAVSLAAAVALGLQSAHHFRDTVAARWPAAKPILAGWCATVGCKLDAPRSIDDVLLEHSELTRATGGADAFVLSVTLHSKSAVALLLPSIDLSLTDADGAVVARRMLAPRDFGAGGLLPPNADVVLKLMLNAGSSRVVGFKAETFYP